MNLCRVKEENDMMTTAVGTSPAKKSHFLIIYKDI